MIGIIELMDIRIRQWAQAKLPFVSVKNPISDHINVILGKNIAPHQTIDLSLLAFVILIDEIQRHSMAAQPMLFVRLVSESNKLMAKAPDNLQSVKEQWRDLEPPELYLLDWETRKYLHIYEEYRCPLPFELIDPPIDGVHAYYNEARGMLDIEHDWEYGRGIQAYYYPKQYRL